MFDYFIKRNLESKKLDLQLFVMKLRGIKFIINFKIIQNTK